MLRKIVIVLIGVILISIALSFKLQPAAKDKVGLMVRKPADMIYGFIAKTPANNPSTPQSQEPGYCESLKQRLAETGTRLEANRPRDAQQALKKYDEIWKATDEFADRSTDRGKEIRDLIIFRK